MKTLVGLALGFVLFLACDHILFSNGVYGRWADPFSTAGRVISELDSVDHMHASRNGIVVVGDSRVAEGFSVADADDVVARLGAPASFGKVAVPGTTPRIWFYLIRQAALQRHHARLVVIMMTSYHDNDTEDLAERRYDLAFLHPLVGPLDIFDLPASFESLNLQEDAVQSILLKGISYNLDLHDLLSAPRTRILTARGWHMYGAEWIRAYPGNRFSLAGLDFNMAQRKLVVSPQTPLAVAAKLQSYSTNLALFQGRPPDNPASHAYRAEWLPRIAALCTAAHARLVVFRIPRGPLHFMVDADVVPTGVVATLQAEGKLMALPADLFDDLERPAYFADELHLNAAGRSILSHKLAATLLDRLGPGA